MRFALAIEFNIGSTKRSYETEMELAEVYTEEELSQPSVKLGFQPNPPEEEEDEETE